MRDHNSIASGERYFDPSDITVPVGLAMLDISRDIPNTFVRQRCFDLTYWMINQSTKQQLAGYRGFHHSVAELLERSLTAGDKVCVILAQGMMAPRLYKIISNVVNYYKQHSNFFVIGHIMAHKGRYPGLHRQMLVVNLETWQRLGKPEFLEQGIFWDRKQTYPNYTVSENTMSADYTPAWIEGAEGHGVFDIVEDGSNWLALAFENNIRVDNFDFETRECKCFLYPYDNPDKLEQAWKNLHDEQLIDSITNYTQRAWLRKLAYQEFIEKNRVYAYNTERLSGEGVRSPGPVDSMFSAAAGFKTVALLRNNGFHEGTVVNYFDWCNASINFKKHLLETWDGIDFDKWLLEHDLEYNFSSTYRGNYKEFWDREIKKEFGGAKEFKELWDRYCKLKHNFFVIDIVNEPEKLFSEIVKQSGTKVLWTTNIWPSMQLHWNVPIDVIEKKYLQFESLIPDELVIYGQDYLANDIQMRVRGGRRETHPVYETTWKRL